jgi:hypothetical protein
MASIKELDDGLHWAANFTPQLLQRSMRSLNSLVVSPCRHFNRQTISRQFARRMAELGNSLPKVCSLCSAWEVQSGIHLRPPAFRSALRRSSIHICRIYFWRRRVLSNSYAHAPHLPVERLSRRRSQTWREDRKLTRPQGCLNDGVFDERVWDFL